MQLHADECCSPLVRRKRVQSTAEGNVAQSRPMPPLLGSGEAVDLLKLFVHVKKRGGYEVISRDGMWEVVGADQGLECLGLGTAIKLIYHMYFMAARRNPVDLKGKAVCGGIGLDEADKMSCDGCETKEGSEEGSNDGVRVCDHKKDWVFGGEAEVIEIDSDSSDSDSSGIPRASAETAIREPDSVAKGDTICPGVEMNGEEEIMVEKLGSTIKWGKSQKRKRKRKTNPILSKILDWVVDVSKDPLNPAFGTLPERTDWKLYGDEHCWKQVLTIRKALFHKRTEALSPNEQIPLQKNMKVHPSMFDKAGEPAEKLRSSPRIRLLGSIGTQNNHISSLSSFNIRKRIPIGRHFQAEMPKWTGVAAENDSKWLGTRIWPPEGKSIKNVHEDGSAQKKIRDHWAHEHPESLELVRSHISRRRMELEDELGSAFYSWKFPLMGEEAVISWTKKEEKIFETVVKENPFSEGKCLWDELPRRFPTKSREELVSYYFNVFILRRRAHQNRCTPSNIDSDDDETELFAGK